MPDIKIDLIRPSPYQPRLTFDLEDIRGGVEKDGILVALTVRKKDGYCELVDGERRWRLAKELGYKTVRCDVIDIDDNTARRAVYKVNKERKNYTPKEEATYFKKLVEKEGMKPRQIEAQLGASHHWVQACLNVWKFPKDVQDHVFGNGRARGPMYFFMSDVRELEPIINRNPDEAIAIARQIIKERLNAEEKRRLIEKREKVVDEERLEKVEKALPEIKVKPPKTAEDFEEAAKALKKKAKELMTPEQKAREKRKKQITAAKKSLKATAKKIDGAEKILNVDGFRKRFDKIKETLKENPAEAKDQLVALGKEVAESKKQRQAELGEEAKRKREQEDREKAKKREEALKKRVEKETREKLLKDEEFLEKGAKKKRKEELKKAKTRVKAEVEPWTEKMASDIAGKIEDALISIAKKTDVEKTAKKKRLMKNYLFQGSIIQSLQDGEIFDPEDPKDTILEWSRSRRNLVQTREILRRELGIK